MRLRKWLEIEGLWNEDLDFTTKTEIWKNVLRELVTAEKERKPALKAVFEDVYAELTEEVEA